MTQAPRRQEKTRNNEKTRDNEKTRSEKMRLDQLLAEMGLTQSRARAADLIRRGAVMVDGLRAVKPGQSVSTAATIGIAPEAGAQYVSRGALKLIAALDAFGFSPKGRAVLDVGASTGGFTEVLLERGAARVYALDVGTGQLHERLRQDPRVVDLENTDVRSLNRRDLRGPIDAIVIDVSFISLLSILIDSLDYSEPGAWLVTLVKPQFEVGRGGVGKGGVVKDETARLQALDGVRAFIAALPGWDVVGTIPSPIRGRDGNQEYLLGARYAG
jgi:23S rRNA (cytidine1920-2'-O)/16S rRNA (cytidine1409-2'-O)-methyltransferase